MITIIFGAPGKGKTSLMTHLGVQEAFNEDRICAMQASIQALNENGFKLTVPEHCLASNYDIIAQKFWFDPRPSRRINPFRLGFANNYVKTHFSLPFECILIAEAQLYLNSRMSMYFPDWQSRFYEQHRHLNLDIFLDTQRPMLIDVNIRELARFLEILNLDVRYNDYNEPCFFKWRVREIENSSLFDKYMASGKKDKTCYREYSIIARYNVFDCYNSQSCKPKFFSGHFDQDFDLNYSSPPEETKESFETYLNDFNDELPENYYIKRSSKK